ncbi:MAG: tRNA lysidine(34) synthetase TilS [Ruminococcaceae bacterium]|nr:tRNA lysidine(34) synthetase TilS [Oscillospiraceae bacterium]
MLNKVEAFLRRYEMVRPGDTVAVALSGGADSTALLYALFLLKEKLGITVEAWHYNHHLRGAESDRDQEFVRNICHLWDIPLHLAESRVAAGKKGLEAAAREARYGCFEAYNGKVATAHTADDNAETVLLHLVRGTGLKGLGGIAPVRGNIIRPMLAVTRQEVEDFLREHCLPHVEDSSNAGDDFLRNRLRHRVMPLLKEENPSLAENLSAMALRLRQDEAALEQMADYDVLPDVETLRAMPAAVRGRMLARFLKENGVKEPEAAHIALAEGLIFSEKPSARGYFPGGVTMARDYDRLVKLEDRAAPETVLLPAEGTVELPQWGVKVTVGPARCLENTGTVFTVCPEGQVILRGRLPGDRIRLAGGSKEIKKLFIDRKIPAHQRPRVPVIADERGVLAVFEMGIDRDRAAEILPAVRIQIERTEIPEE